METWGSPGHAGWNSNHGAPSRRTSPTKHPDPTMVSLTRAEFDRLLTIETTAQAAFDAMCDAPIHEKKFSDAAEALNIALHSPTLGG